MVIQELKAEFNEYFQSPDAELILWIDPSAQWKGIIEHFKKDFRLVEYKGSQLEVKAEVELTWAKGERPKFVLYLPGMPLDALTVLKEYEFSGKVFEKTILHCFRRWGIEFEREHEPELEKILPIAIQYYPTKNLGFWKENNTPAKLRSMICDDETVRQILASPENTFKQLKETERYEIFCDYVQ